MKISSTLLKPYGRQLKSDFETLYHDLQAKSDGIDARGLKHFVEQQLVEMEQFNHSLEGDEATVPQDLFEVVKQKKASLRYARRTFERFLSNEVRVRKMRRRQGNDSAVAA